MNTALPFSHTRSAFFGAALFLAFVVVGALYIVWAKLAGFPPMQMTSVPLGLMVLYALALGLARYFRLRDDQAGDNLYYLGFLYTLTSLGVSLWQFSINDSAEGIVTNFGIAIASTILGVALRVVFNQMRQDPAEVERTARLELADAARRVKQELDATVFEFASFRRASQQTLEEGLVQTRENAERLAKELFDAVKEFPSGTTERLKAATETLASTVDTVVSSLEEVQARLRTMQTPEGIIEIKLQPFISGFTKAVNNQSKATAEQMGDLLKIISQFDDSVRQLSERMSEARSVDEKFLRDLASKLEEGTAETRRLLIELLDKRRSVRPPRPVPERPGLFAWGWFRRGAS
jgi:hypothetical protein